MARKGPELTAGNYRNTKKDPTILGQRSVLRQLDMTFEIGGITRKTAEKLIAEVMKCNRDNCEFTVTPFQAQPNNTVNFNINGRQKVHGNSPYDLTRKVNRAGIRAGIVSQYIQGKPTSNVVGIPGECTKNNGRPCDPCQAMIDRDGLRHTRRRIAVQYDNHV